MQVFPRRTRQNISRWVATLILLAVAVYFGRDGVPWGDRPASSDPFPPEISGAARTIDGDSLHVGQYEVRLKGIDAPEGRQTCSRNGAVWKCGDASRDELRRLIGKDIVTCRVSGRDQHGRLLAFCSAGARDLNAGMVASGMAVAYGSYQREESDAKTHKRGLWSAEFQQPRDWRDDHRGGFTE